MAWLALWPLLTVEMLLLYRRRPPATPAAPLVAVALLVYAAGTLLIAGGLVATVIDLSHGASPFGLPFTALGVLATWWLTAGFATRCGVPPQGLLRMLAHTLPPRPHGDS
jgi:hypothetical protein